MMKSLTIGCLALIATGAIVTAPTSAKVTCQGGYQYIKGTGLHATPFCEIKNLASVARRSYGISTSFAKLRNSNSEREEVCRVIGHDGRVYSTCLEYRDENGSGSRR